jgi:hypothetical protein
MSAPFDFERLRVLITRSRRLKEAASRLRADAEVLDGEIAQALLFIQPGVADARIAELAIEATAVKNFNERRDR